MRLNKFIAQASGASRRGADTLIQEERIKVNGNIANLTTIIEPTDTITLDDKELNISKGYRYVIFNKPPGCICSRTSQGKTKTIYDLLPKDFINLRSVGRLDKNSSGLLILTDDGDFTFKNTHPSFGKEKTYSVTLKFPITDSDIEKLTSGVMLDDGLSQMEIEKLSDKKIKATLSEGRNRQIRRSIEAIDNVVTSLHRTSFGYLGIGNLRFGEWREFTPESKDNV